MYLLHNYNKIANKTTVLVYSTDLDEVDIMYLSTITGRLNKHSVLAVLTQVNSQRDLKGRDLFLPSTLADSKDVISVAEIFGLKLHAYKFSNLQNVTQSIKLLTLLKSVWSDPQNVNITNVVNMITQADKFNLSTFDVSKGSKPSDKS